MAATSPTISRNGSYQFASAVHSPATVKGDAHKRNRSNAGLDSNSPESDDGPEQKRRQPGVKRACNECRQQKLRCDVIQEPFQSCSRCNKHKLDCRVDSNFKRIGKRSRNAEMEREIIRLSAENDQLRKQVSSAGLAPLNAPAANAQGYTGYHGLPINQDQYGSHAAAAVESLLGLKQGLDPAGAYRLPADGLQMRSLGNIILGPDRVQELFEAFFSHYHDFFPLLDPDRSPDSYFEMAPVLFWTVIAIGARQFDQDRKLIERIQEPYLHLMWETISNVPQSYHVVKALCLLCTWPLPQTSTSTDPTFMFAGLMMQVAMQIGLHRPSHAQDFSRFHVTLRDEDIRDRVKTWAACNIVAQTISTGYGQPSLTIYDSSMSPHPNDGEESYALPADLSNRFQIEQLCNKITENLYGNKIDNPTTTSSKSLVSGLLSKDLDELEKRLSYTLTAMDYVYLSAVRLHLRLFAFFNSRSTTISYREELVALFIATRDFLNYSFDLSRTNQPFKFATNYLMQMILAAGFALLKLLNSFFAEDIPRDEARHLFGRVIACVREMSVRHNDLPQRLAEVLAQLWKASGSGNRATTVDDDSLRLRVRGRMSMSVVYDSVWRWREEIQGKDAMHGNLDSAVNNPTNPDASSSTTPGPGAGASPNPYSTFMGAPQPAPVPHAVTSMNWQEDLFDPLSWVLDGQLDFSGVYEGGLLTGFAQEVGVEGIP
ncbi:hypothetical protein M501DRAFT_1001983 [Patellaria atrata CBS 101060]|uniref:Zn(2)-C6 fungal-type domain-containing protein n=1 Tax=Patellaria atrata CBS 101060 TaxID=1346257 RepID=A0A9P4SDS7_9PEZI|nr:hypothetical protein M501DRAFT_1001983 [Patellaria atrata CBS 101060]